MAIEGYCYLHTNGDLIFKRKMVVDGDPEYFDSDFVRAVWEVDPSERLGAWRLLVEATEMGANEARIKELAGRWSITMKDLPNYLIAEEAADGVTDARRKGLRKLVSRLFGHDLDAVFDHLAATPRGQAPDMSAFS